MELKGLAKQGRNVAVAMVSCGLVLGVTAPVAAAQDAETWEMPKVKEELLQDAVDATYEAAGPQAVEFQFSFTGMVQVVYNYSNWEVCNQSPAGGKAVKVSSKPYTVYLELARPNSC